MKKQNLLFIPIILGMGLGLFSCDMGQTGNSSTFPNIPAVVIQDIYMGEPIVGVQGAYLAVPSLIDVFEGECIFFHQFTIDFDNQPEGKYLTATGISKETISQTFLDEWGDPAELGEYSLPISTAIGLTDFFYHGRFFVGINCKDKNPDFRLIYNSEDEEIDWTKNLYLQAKPSSSTGNSSDVSTVYAFNLLNWIWQHGRDTTVTDPQTSEKYDLKYIKANLKYVSKVTDEQPEYTQVNESGKPFNIAIFRKSYL